MAKRTKQVLSKNNTQINVMCGVAQQNYVDGDVWRFPADLYADIASYANIDVNSKDRFQNTLNALLKAFNEKHNCDLKAIDYDVKSGKYDRATPQQQHAQNNATQHNNNTATATADATININQDAIKWIKEQRNNKISFEDIRALLLKNGWSNVLIDGHFKNAFPIDETPKIPNVPTIPTPQ